MFSYLHVAGSPVLRTVRAADDRNSSFTTRRNTIAGPVIKMETIANPVIEVENNTAPVQLTARKKRSIRRKLLPGQQLLPTMFSKSKFRPSHFNGLGEREEEGVLRDELERKREDN